MPLSMWYLPVVRLDCRTAVGVGQEIDCIWGISACCATGRLHGGVI